MTTDCEDTIIGEQNSFGFFWLPHQQKLKELHEELLRKKSYELNLRKIIPIEEFQGKQRNGNRFLEA